MFKTNPGIFNFFYFFFPRIIFVIWGNSVRVYSATTGQWLRDLDGATNQLIEINFEIGNSKLLTGCSVTGEVITWKWKSGVLTKNVQLNFDTVRVAVNGFKFLDLGEGEPLGLLAWTGEKGQSVQMGIYDLCKGELIPSDILTQLNLDQHPVKIGMGASSGYDKLHYFAIIQNDNLFVVDSESGEFKRHTAERIRNSVFTTIACHPEEMLVATGDSIGRIILWRNLFHKFPIRSIYHWHSEMVRTICFTESGSHFFSGGNECVLVKWILDKPDMIDFLPRLPGAVVHVQVSPGNMRLSASTDDNGIQIFNPQHVQTAVIQNFTWVSDDKTGRDPFPIGLKINPRTSSLVLNGRVGHIQFYSTHTRSLLYNVSFF